MLDYPDWLAEAIPNQTMVIFGGKEIMAGDIIEFINVLKRVSKGTAEVYSR